MPDTDLPDLLRKVQRAAEGDSNDRELAAYRNALHEVCRLAGFDADNPDKPRRKPSVIVIENPQEDPTWVTFDDVDVTTMSSFPWSQWADAETAYQATKEWLEALRNGPNETFSAEFLTWLRTWLEQEVSTRQRDFLVDWDSLTLVNLDRADSVRVILTMDARSGRRRCLWVDETAETEHGFIPSIVTENEAGHTPLAGQGSFSSPWYFGKDIDTAKRLVVEFNQQLGVSEDDARDIVLSSMRAGNLVR